MCHEDRKETGGRGDKRRGKCGEAGESRSNGAEEKSGDDGEKEGPAGKGEELTERRGGYTKHSLKIP